MKQTFTLISILIFLSISAFQSAAQITINLEDFDRSGDYTDSITYANSSALPLPSPGENQLWDYGELTKFGSNVTEHFDGTSNPEFPEATGFYGNNLFFQGLEIPHNAYEEVNEDGWFALGGITTEVSYGIDFLTGSPDDTLTFLGGPLPNTPSNEVLQLPLSYGTTWDADFVVELPFELTVAAFGLDKTPGFRQRRRTTSREVIASGQVIIPKSDGTPSPPMDVLVVKAESTVQDSFFLGGAPAPAALLGAFFLEQGGGFESVAYFFYHPGFNSAILFAGDGGGPEYSYQYRSQAADMETGVNELTQYEVNYHPNPIKKGEILTIETEYASQAGVVYFFDMLGRHIQTIPYESASGHQFQIQLPNNILSGIYTYKLNDESGLPIGVGKLQVQ